MKAVIAAVNPEWTVNPMNSMYSMNTVNPGKSGKSVGAISPGNAMRSVKAVRPMEFGILPFLYFS